MIQQGPQALPLQCADFIGGQKLRALEFAEITQLSKLARSPQRQRKKYITDQFRI